MMSGSGVKLEGLKIQEIGSKLLVHACDGFKNPVGKISADYRRNLQCAFDVVLQTHRPQASIHHHASKTIIAKVFRRTISRREDTPLFATGAVVAANPNTGAWIFVGRRW